MAELFNLDALFPGSTEIDQIHRICCVCGAPTTDPTPEINSSFTQLSDKPPMRGMIMAGGNWQEGLKLALVLNFKFPQRDRPPLMKIVPSAPDEALSIMASTLRYDPHERPSADVLLLLPWFNDLNGILEDPTINNIKGIPINDSIVTPPISLNKKYEGNKQAHGLLGSNLSLSSSRNNIQSAMVRRESRDVDLNSWGSLQGISYPPKTNPTYQASTVPQTYSYNGQDGKSKQLSMLNRSKQEFNNSLNNPFPSRNENMSFSNHQLEVKNSTNLSLATHMSFPAANSRIQQSQIYSKPPIRIDPLGQPMSSDKTMQLLKRLHQDKRPAIETVQKRGIFDFFKRSVPGMIRCL
jgi:serine/threonine protein kinase